MKNKLILLFFLVLFNGITSKPYHLSYENLIRKHMRTSSEPLRAKYPTEQKKPLPKNAFGKEDLQKMDFSDTESKKACFKDTNLKNTDFHNSFHVKAKFENVNGLNVNFSNSTIQADFIGTTKGGILVDANFYRAVLYFREKRSKFLDINCSKASFVHSELYDAFFNEVNCIETDFSHSHLPQVSFKDSDCRDAIFSHSNSTGISFRYSKCRFAKFIKANCPGLYAYATDFYYADCQDADFSYSDFVDCSLCKADCRGADFTGTDLSSTKLEGARFDGAKVGNNNRPWFTARVRLLNCLPYLTHHAYEANNHFN